MDAIKNYLESMFARLPNTDEVLRAKTELLQMMEDKYNSLLEEGKKENEAVGIVISEFGNLDEIAETLGIKDVMTSSDTTERRHISREETSQYVIDYSRRSFFLGLGVLFIIMSTAFPVVLEEAGAAFFIVMIAIGIGLIIYSGSLLKKWDFLGKTPCSIDYQTAEELAREQKMNYSGKTLVFIIGVILCIVSVVPMIFTDARLFGFPASAGLSPVLMMLMVGIGVMLIIFSSGKDKAYSLLLSLNDKKTVSGSYNRHRPGEVVYENDTLNTVMSLYWFTVRCVYLIWSFVTFEWYKTWIIWPLAVLIHYIIKTGFGKERIAK